MKPLHLRLTNVGPFPQAEWEIPEGVCAISGTNGAGKSTLIGAIDLALFANGSRDLAPAMGSFGDRLEIELTFEHNGDRYRVRRGFKKGRASVDFEREVASILPGSEWLPLTRETVKETDALICATIGQTRRLASNSWFLAQERSGAFTNADPADRKATLGEALDPGETWTKLHERTKAEVRAAEAALAGTEAAIAARVEVAKGVAMLDDALEDARIAQAQAKRTADDADEALATATAALHANEAAAERAGAADIAHQTAAKEVFRASTKLREATLIDDTLANSRESLAGYTVLADRIPGLEAKVQEARDANAEREAATLRKQAAEREYRAADSAADRATIETQTIEAEHKRTIDRYNHLRAAPAGTEHCALCKQTLGAEARDDSLREYEKLLATIVEQKTAKQAELQTLTAKVSAAREAADAIAAPADPMLTDPAPFERALAQAREAAHDRAVTESLIPGYEATVATIPALRAELASVEATLETREKELAQARRGVGDQAELERAATFCRGAVQTARANLDSANAQVTRLEEQLARARQAAGELAELRKETADQHKTLDLLRLAQTAFHRDGIPALIAENILPVIEAEANRILERLPTSSGTVFRLEMRTQRELKSGDGVKETLDILVSDRTTTREFASYSGGERFRVSFALRWALAKLLRNRRGAQSDVLVIDEPDGLDAGGMDGLAAILREEAGSFSRVLIVSHNPLLASAFEQSVELVSDGEVSRLVGAPVEVLA